MHCIQWYSEISPCVLLHNRPKCIAYSKQAAADIYGNGTPERRGLRQRGAD